ncbi:uncharacterized protein LOC113305910 [Papaver somniferum]|uniref:uncharacterized protein LOC113305910 n=1 Tax=Papaver somniferum TaxID=3469 RepID=UPI000E701BAC|nr:uncharacterized protein LOC113305910 [Papaver somniferum]
MIIHNSSDTTNGNIWIFCNSSLSRPVVVSSSSQTITVKVGDVLVTGIHVACLTVDKRELWEELIDISQMNYPWMIIGDFNVVLSYDEKFGDINIFGHHPGFLEVIKDTWNEAMSELIEAIQYCWNHKFIPKGLNSNILFVLPKIQGARREEQFRPIGLANFIFKIFTKIITIRKVFESAMISVLVNGGPCGFFGVGKDLRQGDPLSPILFILAEEVLSRNLTKKVQEGKIQEMVTRGSFQPPHLMFADDIFIFCNGHKKSLHNLMNLLSKYQLSSGQVVNRNKSKCFVGGISNARRNGITEYLQMGLSELLDTYLGVILNPGRVKSYQVWGMVELMHKMLVGWMGGLGLRRLEVMNKSLLTKLLWKIETEEVEWTQFMSAKYKNKNTEWISSYRQSSIWPGIKWVISEVNEGNRWIVGDGKTISVWQDKYIKEYALIKRHAEYEYQKSVVPHGTTLKVE